MKSFLFALPLFMSSLMASEPTLIASIEQLKVATSDVPVTKCGLFSFLKSKNSKCKGKGRSSTSTSSSSSG